MLKQLGKRLDKMEIKEISNPSFIIKMSQEEKEQLDKELRLICNKHNDIFKNANHLDKLWNLL